MKNSILKKIFLVLLVGVTISSCKKDTPSPTDNMVGTWKSGTSDFVAKVGDKTITQYFTDVMGLTASDAQLYTSIFNATLQQAFTGTIKVNADKTYTSDLGGTTDSGTWFLSTDGKKLTIDSNTDPPMVFDVVKLTANELQLHSSETGTEDLNGDNVPETITIDVSLKFTK